MSAASPHDDADALARRAASGDLDAARRLVDVLERRRGETRVLPEIQGDEWRRAFEVNSKRSKDSARVTDLRREDVLRYHEDLQRHENKDRIWLHGEFEMRDGTWAVLAAWLKKPGGDRDDAVSKRFKTQRQLIANREHLYSTGPTIYSGRIGPPPEPPEPRISEFGIDGWFRFQNVGQHELRLTVDMIDSSEDGDEIL